MKERGTFLVCLLIAAILGSGIGMWVQSEMQPPGPAFVSAACRECTGAIRAKSLVCAMCAMKTPPGPVMDARIKALQAE